MAHQSKASIMLTFSLLWVPKHWSNSMMANNWAMPALWICLKNSTKSLTCNPTDQLTWVSSLMCHPKRPSNPCISIWVAKWTMTWVKDPLSTWPVSLQHPRFIWRNLNNIHQCVARLKGKESLHSLTLSLPSKTTIRCWKWYKALVQISLKKVETQSEKLFFQRQASLSIQATTR